MRYLVIIGWLSCITTVSAQTDPPKKEQKLFLTGYIKLLNTIAIPADDEEWLFDNFIHHRLNLRWYLADNLTLRVEARIRFFFGESNQVNPQFAQLVNNSLDYFELGGEIVKGNSYLLNSFVDRAFLDWYRGKWQVVVGKQRINWSKSYVWNPNDIFNAYSFFDFDYEERRGTDAVLVKYDLSMNSSLEVASNVDESIDLTTMAAKYNFSKLGYDVQLLVGKYQTDIVTSLGWAGQLGEAGFKGEISHFHPYLADSTATLMADISWDYYFASTLSLRLEAIFNSNPRDPQNDLFFLQPVTAKQLTFNRFCQPYR